MIKKLKITKIENNKEKMNNSLSISFSIILEIDKKVPAAPKPSRAMLMTIKAKWYHWITENILVRETSNIKVAAEIKKIPKYIGNNLFF